MKKTKRISTLIYISRAIILALCLSLIFTIRVPADERQWSMDDHRVGQHDLSTRPGQAENSTELITSTNAVTSTDAPVYNVFLPIVQHYVLTPPPVFNWLTYVNYYRATANLPPVIENPELSRGCELHARYVVKTDKLQHYEDQSSPWYTPEGHAAAQSSTGIVSVDPTASDEFAIDGWMQAAFHAISILDPALQEVGYGSYREADGGYQMAACLDVIRGLAPQVPSTITFPIQWPADGIIIPLNQYVGGEIPDSLAMCPDYATPSGLPIILQVGRGNIRPNVTAHSFMQGSTSLEHCVFDETNYIHPDGSLQALGRSILNARDAIVLVPRQPLTPGATYTVSITVDGQTHTWSFTVSGEVHVVGNMPEMQVQ